jgi:sugar phosphate permease
MIRRALEFVREAPESEAIRDPDEVARRYRRLRTEVLLGSMVGYALFYFCRNNLPVALDDLQHDLHLENTDLGKQSATLYMTYGACKLLSGLVADRGNPRAFIVGGLLLSVVANVAFGLSSQLWLLSLLWAANGIVQALGAPASAKLMGVWFSVSERGTKTGIWNISHQAGGGLVLIVAGAFATKFGWRGAMIGPALIALAGSLVIARFIHDRPEASGLPPIEVHNDDPSLTEDGTAGVPFFTLFRERILFNGRSWIVALASMCTYIVRYGALGWTPKYLREQNVPILSAGVLSSLLEFVGIPGMLLCAWLSDRVFHGRRAPVVFASLVLLGLSVLLMHRIPTDRPELVAMNLGLIGFFTYGPQLLLAGVAPVDMSSKRVAGAAIGFTGLLSYVGATLSQLVTGAITDKRYSSWGWEGAFWFWACAAFAGALLCIPLWYKAPVKRAKT